MGLGEWKHFTGYRVRFITFEYSGEIIHLKIIDSRKRRNQKNKKLNISWKCDKFSNCRYEFCCRGLDKVPWGVIVNRLRISLAYQFNFKSREVFGRMALASKNHEYYVSKDGQVTPHLAIRHRYG